MLTYPFCILPAHFTNTLESRSTYNKEPELECCEYPLVLYPPKSCYSNRLFSTFEKYFQVVKRFPQVIVGIDIS